MTTTRIQIEHIGLMGQGVGYDAGGNIYFVPGSVPGDKVEIDFDHTAKRYRDARLLSIIEPSPHRKSSGCPVFGICGGCDWLDLDYSEQVKHKASILNHVLERSPFIPKEILPFVPSANTLGYRSRIQLKRAKNLMGFHRRQSHDLVPVDRCLVAEPRINQELEIMRTEASPSEFTNVELCLEEDGTVSRVYNAPHGSKGFTQINRGQNEVLKTLVADRVQRAQASRVLELFCGDGNLTFAYSGQVAQVVGIDSSAACIDRATRLGAELKNVSFIKHTVGPSVLRKLPASFENLYDTLILDPPRAGMVGVAGPKNPLEPFIRSSVTNIIYISCSPLSFSIDVRPLKKAGFCLEEIQGIDMFPQTRHIELVARFRR
jgi:23S rRNA (uracil1939-C5)-methyltransferase